MSAQQLGLPGVRRTPGEAAEKPAAGPARPDTPALVDRFGRVATDLRVSLTDRCNLRCTYCMPAEGLPWLAKPDLLDDGELLRLISLAVTDLGVREIRLTGGEPLLRKGITELIAGIAALDPRPEISLTTNGIGLAARAADFAAAGLDRLNVSLDTLDRKRFVTLTRRDRLADVIAGLHAAAEAGLTPVKINTVLLRGVNDDEASELLEFALQHGFQLRFIEQMPLDAGHAWNRGEMVTAAEIQQSVQGRFVLKPHDAPRDGAPAELFDVIDHGDVRGTVGIIASVTRPFCGACDRTRLTADGQIRNCLFARSETDLRGLLRSGADDAAIADAWRAAMWGKAAGHGIDDPGFLQPDRPMSAIGG